jgi:hypothetical protein
VLKNVHVYSCFINNDIQNEILNIPKPNFETNSRYYSPFMLLTDANEKNTGSHTKINKPVNLPI